MKFSQCKAQIFSFWIYHILEVEAVENTIKGALANAFRLKELNRESQELIEVFNKVSEIGVTD